MKNILLLIISISITLLAAEVWMAWFNPIAFMKPPEPTPTDGWRELLHRSSAIQGLSYELTPNREKNLRGALVRTNSHGMRDNEPLDGINNPVCNVIVLGDSYTFGFGVKGNETYPNVLEKLLTNYSDDRKIQVLNLGVGGYSSKDEAVVLKSKGMKWDPQLIIIGYVLNDPQIDPIQPLHRHYQDVAWWQYFNVFRLIAHRKHEYDINVLGGGNYIRYLHNRDSDQWHSVQTAFADIQKTVEGKDIPVLLVIFPMMRGGGWGNYQYDDLHSQVANEGKNSRFRILDLTNKFSAQPQRLLKVAPNNAHPNARGHKLAAETIHQAIQASGLLKCK